MAVLPAELENVPDHFLHQLEGLLDLRPNQRGEVHYSHVHLHTHTHTQRKHNSAVGAHRQNRKQQRVHSWLPEEKEENTKCVKQCWR